MTLAQLYERHFDHLYLLCRRLVRRPDLAEELTQEVFVHAAQSLTRFIPLVDHGIWLRKIATNLCLNHLTKASTRREQLCEQDDPVLLHAATHDTTAELLDLASFAERLPQDERAVFIGKFIEGHSNDELAKALGCTERTVINRANRAAKIFSEWYHAQE